MLTTYVCGGVDAFFIASGEQGNSNPLEHLPIPAEYEWFPRAGLQKGVAELGDLYVALSRDLASGTQAVPTFHDAVWQQQLFEQIQDSSETGKRINLCAMTTIGLIGAGHIGSQIARLAMTHGYNVVISNSRGPET